VQRAFEAYAKMTQTTRENDMKVITKVGETR
jgi:hypothetical protein